MQPRSYAKIGAWTLGSSGLQLTGNARMSFELVGKATTAATAVVDAPAPAPTNPIEAARAWLADPARRSALAPALVARAEASVLVAERYFKEIDSYANELAVAANADGSGDIDPDALDRLADMVGTLTTFSEKLRELLDPVAPVADANERINGALMASRAGGLPALVAAL